jgi:hypothetical protein
MYDEIMEAQQQLSMLTMDKEVNGLLARLDFGPGYAFLALLLGPCITSHVYRSGCPADDACDPTCA